MAQRHLRVRRVICVANPNAATYARPPSDLPLRFALRAAMYLASCVRPPLRPKRPLQAYIHKSKGSLQHVGARVHRRFLAQGHEIQQFQLRTLSNGKMHDSPHLPRGSTVQRLLKHRLASVVSPAPATQNASAPTSATRALPRFPMPAVRNYDAARTGDMLKTR